VPDIVWIVTLSAVMIGLAIFALRLEPHWSSKDGERFICRAQLLDAQHQPVGRWREVRGQVEGDDIVVRTRSLMSRQIAGRWNVYARGVVDQRKRRVYLLRSMESDQQLALRMPGDSHTVPLLDARLPE
jgi:hypothetical protein